MRDDFDDKIKEILARRVGYRCSNPNCRQLTSGPQTDPTKAVNIGVAAHITAASPGGPRYDPRMTSEERKSSKNGIWLCQNHAKLVDNDEKRYSVDLLKEWKRLSERAALLAIESKSQTSEPTQNNDLELIRFYSQCLDRPAFQDPFEQEGSTEAFDKAIEDTITALNTGCLRSRDGTVLAQSKGKSYLSNRSWREKMDVIADLLRAIRSRYSLAVEQGQIHLSPEYKGRHYYTIHDRQIAEWMDNTRAEVIEIFSEICRESGIPTLNFPRHFGRRSRH